MAPETRPTPNRKTAGLVLGVLALFVCSALTPLALAKEGPRESRQDARDEARERAADHRKDMVEKARAEMHKKFMDRWMNRTHRSNITIELDGNGTSKDNLTYQVELDGAGIAKAKMEDGNLSRLKGFARVHAKVIDANGTVVKEADFRVMYRVHENATGDLRWQLVSVGHTPFGLPRLMLRGDAVQSGDSLDLTGSGRAVIRTDDGRLVLRPLEVSGTITKQ